MMDVIIHRGQNQIGGNIIEIATAKTRILLDVGLELDQDEVRKALQSFPADGCDFSACVV